MLDNKFLYKYIQEFSTHYKKRLIDLAKKEHAKAQHGKNIPLASRAMS